MACPIPGTLWGRALLKLIFSNTQYEEKQWLSAMCQHKRPISDNIGTLRSKRANTGRSWLRGCMEIHALQCKTTKSRDLTEQTSEKATMSVCEMSEEHGGARQKQSGISQMLFELGELRNKPWTQIFQWRKGFQCEKIFPVRNDKQRDVRWDR